KIPVNPRLEPSGNSDVFLSTAMKWVILLFGLPATSLSMAQNPESEPVRVTEELMGFFDEDEDRAAHLENILQNRSELLDLNKATAEELRGLHIFSETQLTR